ncbi:MAG: glycosyltransferase [Candidatus Cloacimonetes bacterium]|nr:glycosyltransferase [Candidatus Cloacimonadota bacterium]
MIKLKVLVHIANNTTGGGVVVANDLITYINNYIKGNVIVDLLANINMKIPNKKNINKIIRLPNNSSMDSFYINNFKLPKIIKKGDYSFLLNMCNYPIKTNTKVKQLIYFQNPNRLYKINNKNFIKKLERNIRNYEFWKKTKKDIYFAFQTKIIRNIFLRYYKKKKYEKYPEKNAYLIPSKNFNERQKFIKFRLRQSSYFCYISKYYKHKNFEIVPHALRLLPRRYKIVLTIDKDDSKTFLNLCKKLKVDNRIVFLGQVTQREVFEIMSKSIAVIMPTKLETYGLPYYEAMQIGAPIISAESRFSKDACGSAILYHQPDDYHMLSNQMKRIIKSPELRKELSQKSLKQFEKKKVTLSEFGDKIFNTINKIMKYD